MGVSGRARPRANLRSVLSTPIRLATALGISSFVTLAGAGGARTHKRAQAAGVEELPCEGGDGGLACANRSAVYCVFEHHAGHVRVVTWSAAVSSCRVSQRLRLRCSVTIGALQERRRRGLHT